MPCIDTAHLSQIGLPRTIFQSAPFTPLAASGPRMFARLPHVSSVSRSALYIPQISSAARRPWNLFNSLASLGAAPRSKKYLGPCVRTRFSSVSRASSASFWKRAVFCFSSSRSIPSCLLDASNSLAWSSAFPARSLASDVFTPRPHSRNQILSATALKTGIHLDCALF